MKKYLLIIGGITLLFFTALSANLFGFTDEAASSSSVYATWVSLLLPVIAIVLTLVSREVVLSLFAGLWIGMLLMASFNPFEGTSGALNILTEALINPDHVSIIVFSLLLGGMVGVMSRSGGTHGIVNALEKLATTRKRGDRKSTHLNYSHMA